MTYCVGLLLHDGIVMLSDSRTNAGVDSISTFGKMHAWQQDGDRALVYCEDGFGPQEPWGAVLLSQASMGDDDQWHGSLYDAAVSFGLCDSVEPA